MEAYQSEVDTLSNKVSEKELEVSNLNDDILTLENEIDAKQEEINEKEDKKQETVDKLKSRLRADYISGHASLLDLLMGASDFGEFLSSVEYIKRIAAYDNDLASTLENQINEIETAKAEVETDIKNLNSQKEEMEIELDELAIEQDEVTEAKSGLQNIASDIQDRIKDSKAESDRLAAIAASAAKTLSNSSSSYEYTGGVVEGTVDGGSGWGWPVPGYSITSGYGSRSGSMHYGVDFPSPVGTNIVASKGGTVIASTYGVYGQGYGGFGNVVVIDHGNGYVTLYAHMSQRSVSAGETVSKGQLIGLVGNTGNSSGSHLHFEVRTTSGNRLDPANFLNS